MGTDKKFGGRDRGIPPFYTQCYTFGAAVSVMTSGKPDQSRDLESRSIPVVWWLSRGG